MRQVRYKVNLNSLFYTFKGGLPVSQKRMPVRLAGVVILLCGVAFLPVTALAANGNWYVAADVGQSHFSDIHTDGNLIYPAPYSYTDTGYRLSAGYEIGRYLGVEAGYIHMGEVTGSNTVIGNPFCGLICMQSYIVTANLETRGWVLELVARYPFNNCWEVYARAGGIQAHSELDANYKTIPPYNSAPFPPTVSNTSADLDRTYGVGVSWLFARSWMARLGWDRFVSLGYQLPIGSFNVSLTSLGIAYQF